MKEMDGDNFERNELQDYFKLISLLHKERPIQYREEVEGVIKNEPDNKKRIKKVQDIDRKYLKVANRNKRKIEFETHHKDKSIISSRKKLKASGFFSYLFFNRKMVVNFANRTESIVLSFFGLTKHLSTIAEVMWNDLYEKTKKYLIAPVNQIVLKGWMALDINSYNLVTIFDKFLKNFIRYGEDLSTTRSANENLRTIEGFIKNYLKVIFIKDYREILEEVILEYILTDKRFKTNYKDIRRLLKEFLEIESRSLCFFNVLNAVFIIYYNRFIKLSELCKHYGVEDINHYKYQFSPKIEAEVREYIEKIEHKYKNAEKELFYLKYIEEISFYSSPNNSIVKLFNSICFYELISKGTNFDKIKKVIDNEVEKKDEKDLKMNPFNTFKMDVSKFVLKFITGFKIIYKNILTDPITIDAENDNEKNKTAITLFNNNPFQAHFLKISDFTRDLSLLSQNEKFKVRKEEYFFFIDDKLLETKEAEKICELVESIVSELYSIANKICFTLFKNYKASCMNPDELLHVYKEKNEPINLSSDELCLIPYAFNTIIDNRIHSERKILNVLNEIALITINFVYLMKYSPLMERLVKRTELIDDSEYYVKIKSKII